VLKLKLKVIERRMCALERTVEVLIDRLRGYGIHGK